MDQAMFERYFGDDSLDLLWLKIRVITLVKISEIVLSINSHIINKNIELN
jgi:hypothetical protein